MRLVLILFVLIFNISYANEEIEQIIRENSRSNISILVKDLKSNKILYQHNAMKLMLPGSVAKSFTVYAALDFLKEDFSYKTQVLTKDNNIYFKFSGDPTLTRDHLAELVKAIPQGKKWQIFIDDVIFDQTYNADGTTFEDTKFCYAAPSSAIVIDKNCFKATLTAANIEDKQSILDHINKNSAKIDNQIMTKNNPSCVPHLVAKSDNSYILSGCIDMSAKPLDLNVAYQDPRLMIKSFLIDLFNKNNINYIPEIEFQAAPTDSEVLVEHSSEKLADMLKLMHKDSDNLMANNIGKTIGAYFFKKQASFMTATQAIKKIIANKSKIDLKDVRLFDPAGESRYNLIAADQLVNLYIAAYNNKDIKNQFYESLPIMAKDGTLKSRFTEFNEIHGKIAAKTGSLRSVSSIVGIMNEEVVFAIMFNSSLLPKHQLIKLEEKILFSIWKNFILS